MEEQTQNFEQENINFSHKSVFVQKAEKRISEKKGLRKTASKIGLALLVLAAVTNLWGTVYYFIMGKLGYTAGQAYQMVSEPAILQCVQIVISMLIFTVPFVLAAHSGGYRVDALVKFKRVEKKKAINYYFLGAGFCVLANLVVAQIGNFLESLGISYNVDTGDYPTGFFGFLLVFLSTAVLPAFVEEFACRGIMFGMLRKYGDAFAIFATALVFGFMHGNFEQMPFTFLVGIILAYIVVKTGSMIIAVAVHFTNNFISVAAQYFFAGFSDNIQNVIFIIIYSAFLILGIIGLVSLSSSGEDFALEKSETALKEKEKITLFITCPAIIIFLIVCLLQAVAYFFV